MLMDIGVFFFLKKEPGAISEKKRNPTEFVLTLAGQFCSEGRNGLYTMEKALTNVQQILHRNKTTTKKQQQLIAVL